MPYLKIQTNVSVSREAQGDLLAEASRTVAMMLGKPERYVMVVVLDDQTMRFAGSDAPLAYLELKSIGLPRERTADYSRTLSELMGERLGIPADRVYIEFADAAPAMWGWNGATF